MRIALRALVLAVLVVAGGATAAGAQVFFGSQPHPLVMVGPLIVRANVTPALGDVVIDVLFSLVIPPNRSAGEVEQDLFLLWPGSVTPAAGLGPPDPELKRTVEQQDLAVLEEGRLHLEARNLYQRDPDGRRVREPIPGGAPFVTFVREGGALGLSPPATYIRIPWTDKNSNRTWLLALRLVSQGLIKPKPGTWLERTVWGDRQRVMLSFHDVRQRPLFPMYFWQRDRVVRLSEDPSQLIINFKDADRLKVDELFPQSARRQLSETLENTDVVSLFLDRAEGLRPQTLTVQFGYFSGWQGWAPVLFAFLFFALGNLAGPLTTMGVRRLSKALAGRVHIGRADPGRAIKERGVVLSRAALARIVPGETRYQDVLRLCDGHPEELERLASSDHSPDQKTLVYRGRRVVPHRKRSLGWLGTVDHWDVEHHEVEITLEGDVVRDVQARVRRTRLAHPEAAS